MAVMVGSTVGEEGRAVLGSDDAGDVEDAGDLGGEVPAAGEDLGARAIGDHDAVAEEDDALGELGGELDVVGGDEDGGTLRGEAGDAVAVEAAGEGDREGEALALAAGEVARIGVDRVLHADRAQGGEAGGPG